MYAIAKIIYGYPLDEKLQSITKINNFIEDNEKLVLGYYSGGSSVSPYAIGAEMGQFDEACDYVNVSNLRITPFNEEAEKFYSAWTKIPADIKKIIQAQFPKGPFVFFLWTTS